MKYIISIALVISLILTGCTKRVHQYTYSHSVLTAPDNTKTLKELEQSDASLEQSSSRFEDAAKSLLGSVTVMVLYVGVFVGTFALAAWWAKINKKDKKILNLCFSINFKCNSHNTI